MVSKVLEILVMPYGGFMFDKGLFRIVILSLLKCHGSLLYVWDIHKIFKYWITPKQTQCMYSGTNTPIKSKPSMSASDLGPLIP